MSDSETSTPLAAKPGIPEIFDTLRLVHGDTAPGRILDSFGQQPGNADNLVLLSEFANYSAKIARENFKEIRDQAKADKANGVIDDAAYAAQIVQAKRHDEASGSLMKAAKGVLLREAIAAGATAAKTRDAGGSRVALLRSPNHQIGLHNLGDQPMEALPELENGVGFSGFRRQWLSPLTIASSLGDKQFEQIIGAASLHSTLAGKVEDALSHQGYSSGRVTELGKATLLTMANEAIPNGKLRDDHTLVATVIQSAGEEPVRNERKIGPAVGPENNHT